MKLPGQQVEQIQDALLAAYSSWPDLRRMVRIELDQNLEEIVPSKAALREVVFGLIVWAEETNQVDKLLMGATNQNPGNRYLADTRQSYISWRQDAASSGSEPSLRDPVTIFSEAYRADVSGELVKALVLYQMIQSEPQLAVAVSQRLRALEYEMKQSYVLPDGSISNKRLLEAPVGRTVTAIESQEVKSTTTNHAISRIVIAIIICVSVAALLIVLWFLRQ